MSDTSSRLAPRKLDDTVSVAAQLAPEDFAEAARLGFRTVINNRPDGEDPGQLSAAEAADLARAAGLGYVHVPVTAATMGPAIVSSFAQALATNPGPVLAHCRSGTRSTHLWAFATARAGRYPVDDIVARGGAAGYDLEPIRPVIARYAEGA